MIRSTTAKQISAAFSTHCPHWTHPRCRPYRDGRCHFPASSIYGACRSWSTPGWRSAEKDCCRIPYVEVCIRQSKAKHGFVFIFPAVVGNTGIIRQVNDSGAAQIIVVLKLKITVRRDGERTAFKSDLNIGKAPEPDNLRFGKESIGTHLAVIISLQILVRRAVEDAANLRRDHVDFIKLAAVNNCLTGHQDLGKMLKKPCVDIVGLQFFVLDDNKRVFERIGEVLIEGNVTRN